MSLLARSSARYVLRHRWQFGLAVLGVALGTAIVVATDMAIASARTAFRVSVETVAGATTHQVTGGPAGIDEATYVALRLSGMREAAPVVEEHIGLAEAPGRVFHLLGVDVLAEAPFRPFLAGGAAGGAGVDVLLQPGTAWLGAATARDLGVTTGSTLTTRIGGRSREVVVGALLDAGDRLGEVALESLVVVDIATAQELLDRVGTLDRIDLIVPDGPAGALLLESIRAALPPDAILEEAGRAAAALDRMTRAFRLNLLALSLLVLVFALFFIHNAMTFAVVQRRERIATLRTLGVTRGQVFGQIVGEAALLGGAGALLGVPLGILLGSGFINLVTGTITDLYFVVTVRDVGIPAGSLVKGVALALAGSVLAALPAAAEASAARPRTALTRSTLENRARTVAPVLALAGVVMLVAGGALLLPPSLVVNFGGLFSIVIGCALITPVALLGAMRLVAPVTARFGAIGRLAPGGVAAALSRTAPAAAALMVAVATAIALGIMIGSFRDSVVAWLDSTLNADVYVSAPGLGASRPEGSIDAELVTALIATPGVLYGAGFRSVHFNVDGEPLRLGVLDPDVLRRDNGARSEAAVRHAYTAYTLLAGDAARAWAAFDAGRGVLVSEPLARGRGFAPGDSLRLPAPHGETAFEIVGVYRDYGSDRGAALMHRDAYTRVFGDPGIGSVAFTTEPGIEAEHLVARMRERSAGADQAIFIRSDRTLREASLDVFDRTFLITWVLRLLAVVVAFIGILAALAALQLERAQEIAVLRAGGVTRGQVRALVLGQSGLLGLAAGVLAMPAGLLMAAIMIHVINVRSFGWTIDMRIDAATLGQSLGLALLAALLAGVAPAWRMANAPIAANMRGE
jgi:putative ABC transport system permease protein